MLKLNKWNLYYFAVIQFLLQGFQFQDIEK